VKQGPEAGALDDDRLPGIPQDLRQRNILDADRRWPGPPEVQGQGQIAIPSMCFLGQCGVLELPNHHFWKGPREFDIVKQAAIEEHLATL
jgi:hypothetical protein